MYYCPPLENPPDDESEEQVKRAVMQKNFFTGFLAWVHAQEITAIPEQESIVLTEEGMGRDQNHCIENI